MLIPRHAASGITQAAAYFPVIALLGPRQSGKTTLARMLFPHYSYVSLEELDRRAQAQADPRTFLQSYAETAGVIIDEFQHVPQLLSYMQTWVDEKKQNGFFILTGSQNFLMNNAITQSLAGRVSIHTILPLSIAELKQAHLLPDEIEPLLAQGCYPALYSSKVPSELLYGNYVQTYLERDVRELAHVGDLALFRTFLSLCAARNGQTLNLTDLGNACGISDKTAARWLSILETSYIIVLVQPYHVNFGKRLTKAPKLYFYDPGLVCFLLGVPETTLFHHPIKGALFESTIIAECYKWFYNHARRPSIYFWRDKSGHEVDCLIQYHGHLIPIEIKASRTALPRFFEGLTYFNTLAGNDEKAGYLIYGLSQGQEGPGSRFISWRNVESIFKAP